MDINPDHCSNRIIKKDCKEKMEIAGQTVFFKSSEDLSELADNSITLVVTSPPYWNVRDYGGEQIGFRQGYQDYIGSLNRVWEQCIQKLESNGKIAINFQPLPISAEESGFNRRIIKDIMWDVQHFMHQHDFHLSGMHYWDKAPFINNVAWGSYPKPTNIHSNTSFEQIFVFVKPGKTRIIEPDVMQNNLLNKDEWRHWAVSCIWNDIAPVIKINSKGENTFGHSAPYPEDIPYRIIRMHTVEGEKVLDPFLGSGTTLKICRFTKRKGFGYEINSEYREKINSRITEDWEPPFVDSLYINLGSEKLQRIIDTSIAEALNKNVDVKNPSIEVKKRVLKRLAKEKVFSRAIIAKLSNEEQKEEE